jgi:uncharacterized protein YigA (DUF484 family)
MNLLDLYQSSAESVAHSNAVFEKIRIELMDARFKALGVNNNQEARDAFGPDWIDVADRRLGYTR